MPELTPAITPSRTQRLVQQARVALNPLIAALPEELQGRIESNHTQKNQKMLAKCARECGGDRKKGLRLFHERVKQKRKAKRERRRQRDEEAKEREDGAALGAPQVLLLDLHDGALALIGKHFAILIHTEALRCLRRRQLLFSQHKQQTANMAHDQIYFLQEFARHMCFEQCDTHAFRVVSSSCLRLANVELRCNSKMGCGSFGSGPFMCAPLTFGSGRVHMEWDCNNDDEFQDELTLELFNLAALPLSVSPLSANRHTIWLQGGDWRGCDGEIAGWVEDSEASVRAVEETPQLE